jgi:maltose alpha-D-glucosyltransferase/alpha-amylase
VIEAVAPNIAHPEPPWYQTAVFYEVPVYAFRDSTGNGTGDFRGLTEKLDYLEWLGIDCLWILPFYGSPLRDGGYDVSDFRSVLPTYGDVEDVRRFLGAAHERGLRVIADMIVNHTSDQHPWFQEARLPGSATRDWYVWSDTDRKWPEARVIFTDTHDSNWTWDEVAGAYYWHRFFWHQPDLNFDHPDVCAAMKDVVRFWLDAGFDGLRLDAVPYLYERDGTNCENLPETHAYLKELRAMVDAEYDDKILLAEANQWPEDVIPYFGNGDECHMAFHFPVMPRLFMALAEGHATSIVDILGRTPAIPDGCQWGIFLRNHDELTLEMVTEEERAFMYRHYAPEPSMKKNVGIRRRLAPLLDGDRRKIELLVGLLLSLPGSPILYYGDEIGMGDIHTLEDRDGVRTPMQWNSAPSVGFSEAAPEDLYLPVVASEAYGRWAVNVADQQGDPASLLTWTRDLLAARRRHPVFGTGEFVALPNANHTVFVFLRRTAAETVLVLANLSGERQRVAADPELAGFPDEGLVDITGRPQSGGDHWLLEPYEFRWLEVEQP